MIRQLVTLLAGMVPVSQTEAGWAYNGPLSTYAEWHSLTVGFGAGIHYALTGDLWAVELVVAFAFGRGFAKSQAKSGTPDAHLRDIAEEPAYGLFGIGAGILLGRLFGAQLAGVLGFMGVM